MHLFLFTSLAYLLGCICCYLLQAIWGIHTVTSIALTGFLGSFLYSPRSVERSFFHNAIYAGAFAGACSPDIIESFQHVLLLSLIGSVVFYFLIPYLVGFGGKLGMVSFISSLIFFIAKSLW